MSTNSISEPGHRRKSFPSVLRNLALSIGVFIFCAAATEMILRLMGYGNVEIYEPDPMLFWRLKPKQQCFTKIGHKPVSVNSFGTRGAEFAVPKPAHTVRIISLGDSKTFGWGLSDTETYSAGLERLLESKFKGAKRVEVINCGVNAWSYPQMTLMFRERALKWQPDLVVLGDANLWTQFSENADPAFAKKFMGRVWIKNKLRRLALYHYIVEVKLKDFYEQHRTRFIPVDPKQDELFKEQQQSDPDAVFRKAIEDLCTTALSNRVQPVLIYIPTQTALLSTNDTFSSVRRVKQEISASKNVPFLDLGPSLKPKAREVYLDADPVHLNAAGNQILAEQLFQFLSPMLVP